jgi:hypothetical protein
MSSPSRRVCAHAVAVLSLSLPAIAGAQSDADLKTVSATVLTMPRYKQYLDATVNLANLAAKNPGVAGRMKDSGEKSIAEQVQLLDSDPQLKGAIAATGLTTKDYVTTQWALLQTGMAYAMTKGSGASQDEVAQKAGVSKANLDFYAKNEAEINRLAKEAQARAPQAPDDDDDEGADDDYDDSGEDDPDQ